MHAAMHARSIPSAAVLPALTMRQQMRLIRVSVAAVVAGSTLRSVLRSAMLRRAVLRGVMVPRVQASEV